MESKIFSANQHAGQNGTWFFVYLKKVLALKEVTEKYSGHRGNFRHYKLWLLVPKIHGGESITYSKWSSTSVGKQDVYKVNGVTNS